MGIYDIWSTTGSIRQLSQLNLTEALLWLSVVRKNGLLFLQFPNKDYHISPGGLATIISHTLQLQVEKVNFLVSIADRLESPFLHPAATRRVETLLQAKDMGSQSSSAQTLAGQRFHARRGKLRPEDCTTPASTKVD